MNNNLNDILISNIFSRTAEKHWSLKMLADQADLPYETIKKLHNGKIIRPSFYCIWKIANALEMSMDCLAGKEDSFTETRKNVLEMQEDIKRLLTVIHKEI